MLSILNDSNAINTLSSSPYFLNVKKVVKSCNLYIVKHCYKSDATNDVVRDCDGTILSYTPDTNTFRVVCFGGRMTKSIRTMSVTKEMLSTNRTQEMIDGTMIRLYYLDGVWRTSTRGHTDAHKARWTTDKSYGQMWAECLASYPEFSTHGLDKSNTYVFIIQHVGNPIICPIQVNKIYLTDIYDNNTLSRVNNNNDYNSVKVDNPESILFNNTKELRTFTELNDITVKGVILYDTDTNERVVVLTQKYEEVNKTRDNWTRLMKEYVKSYIIWRYRNDHHLYLHYYPYCRDVVSYVAKTIITNTLFVHNLYMEKHVRKNQNTTLRLDDHDIKRILYKTHGYYLETGVIITKPILEHILVEDACYYGFRDFTKTH